MHQGLAIGVRVTHLALNRVEARGDGRLGRPGVADDLALRVRDFRHLEAALRTATALLLRGEIGEARARRGLRRTSRESRTRCRPPGNV